jgi:hypothetical protein
MTIPDFKPLQVCSEHFVSLSSILDHRMDHLRAVHFRRAERNLTHLRHVFTSERAVEAEDWLHIHRSVQTMQATLTQTAAFKEQAAALEKRLTVLEEQLAPWKSIGQSEREAWNELVQVAREYLDAPQRDLEEKACERFNLYSQLKDLVTYAEEVDHLCSALKHYSKRDQYLEEKGALEKKIVQAELRLKSVKRGFFLSLILCVLVVTLPLCLPFGISLWSRIREIEKQLSQFTEERRRVLRRLDLAAEGVIAAEDITAVLGERSLADIRNVLEEVKALHREFGGNNPRATLLVRAIILEAAQRHSLEGLFGASPAGFRPRLEWAIQNIENKRRENAEIFETATEILKVRQMQKELLRGYNEEILRDAIERMLDRMAKITDGAWQPEILEKLMPLCKCGPQLVERVRDLLSQVSYGKSISETEWMRIGVEVKSTSTTLNALLLEAELSAGLTFDEHNQPSPS